MRAIFKKQISLQTATAYLILKTLQERPDIVDFLKGNEFPDQTINERVREYLSKIGLLRNNQLTKAGKKLLETGTLFVQEEGKYKIWFVENDSFLGTKILYFKRERPQNDHKNISQLSVRFEKNHKKLALRLYDSFMEFQLISQDVIWGKKLEESSVITLIWEWEDLEKSYYYFEGELLERDIDRYDIKCDKNLKTYIKALFPDWNQGQQRLKVYFDELTDEERKTFLKNDRSYGQGFDDIQFFHLPIMPYDKQEAIKWRNWFLDQEVEKSYLIRSDFQQVAKESNQKIVVYTDKLNIPDIVDYRSRFYNEERAKQSPEFWHLAATLDLNPDLEELRSFDEHDKIEFEPNQELSFDELASLLKNSTAHDVNVVFYYDRFVKSEKQQKAMLAFFQAVQADKSFLLTNLSKQRHHFISQEPFSIEEVDIKDIFHHERRHHDRYIIFAQDQENYTVWRLSNSIDYIHFDEQEIYPETVGIMDDNIVFLKVKKTMLRKELRDYIESQLS